MLNSKYKTCARQWPLLLIDECRPRFHKLALAFYCLFGFILASCAHAPKKHNSLALQSAEKVLSHHGAARKQISGSGSIAWVSKSPKRNIAAAGILLVDWPDRLRLEVNDPLGNQLALLVVNGNDAWFASNDQPEILRVHGGGLQKLLQMPISGSDLVRAFLARPDSKDFVWSDEGEGETVLVRTNAGNKESLVFSERLNEPELWTRELSDSLIRVDYESYAMHNGVEFPESVKISWLVKGQIENSLLWTWSDWQPNVPSRPELFEIPQANPGNRPLKSF